MIYGSVCSGIEAASVAWSGLGWEPRFFAEIETFASAVLRARFPSVPNLGDLRAIRGHAGPIDLLVGGTPCQSFSVAGARAGLADPRGNLALEYLRLAERLRPRWLVWENVPGILSVNGGRDFGIFVGALGQLGYCCSYRILDAQYFGVAQRRRRLFVVGYFGDWRPSAAVLFEPESLSGHPPPRRAARENVAPPIAGVSNGGGANGPGRTVDDAEALVVGTLDARATAGGFPGTDGALEGHVVSGAVSSKWAKGTGGPSGDEAYNLVVRAYGRNNGSGEIPTAAALAAHKSPRLDFESETLLAFDARQNDVIQYGSIAGPLDTDGTSQAVAFTERTRAAGRKLEFSSDLSYALTNPGAGGRSHSRHLMDCQRLVRRLTPRECERLQGFPDDWTLINYRGKPAKDGPRYRAIGNAFAVPVIRWIGERIARVDALLR